MSTFHWSRPVVRGAIVALALLGVFLCQDVLPAQASTPEKLTSRPRLPAPAVKPLAVGTAVTTGPGERRRLQLPDGSFLYVNERSALKLDAARRVTLSTGEVFA